MHIRPIIPRCPGSPSTYETFLDIHLSMVGRIPGMLDPDPRLKNVLFVVFSDDWGRHPSSCQHLFRRILPHAEVIWVNTVGLRSPRLTLYDVKRALQVVGSWLRSGRRRGPASAPHAAGPAPAVLRPAMWPSFRRTWSAALNQWLLGRAVRRALDGRPGKQAILVSTIPVIPSLFRDPRFRKTVYYCVDDFTEWHGIDGEAMRRLEAETLAACGLMIATSTPLLESRGARARASALLTHGVDAEHFSRSRPDPSSPLAAMPHPIVGMFGVFDQRIDVSALRAAARAQPQATFACIGPVVDRDPREFGDIPNLRFLPPSSYRDLPAQVAHFDVCILPYVVDRTTRNINPLKLKEYLATGKPVVATPLPEAVRLEAYLTLAPSDRFAEAVAEALARSGNAAPAPAADLGREAFLEGESWDAKADAFLNRILDGV